MSPAGALLETLLVNWQKHLLASMDSHPLLSLPTGPHLYLEILLPHSNELFPALVQENTRKSWTFWLPADEGKKEQTASSPATSSATLVVTGPEGEALDRQGILKILKSLLWRDQALFQEFGLPHLFLGFGMLDWQDRQEARYRSSLVLVPVHLNQPSSREPLHLQPAGEGPMVNPALEYRLGREFQFRGPALAESNDQPLTQYFDEWQKALAGPPGWHVSNTCILAVFPVFRGNIYRDLENHADLVKSSAILQALSTKTHAPIPLLQERELDQLSEKASLLDADASQRLCLEAARRGESFVLLAPPGTGKTQTLANILGDAILRGKKTLLVSEKMAALDHVAQRLREVGLGHFLLELHINKTHKREVIADLARCAKEPATFPKDSSSVDLQRHEKLQDHLRHYVQALHEVREPSQRTVWEALAELTRWHDFPLLTLEIEKPLLHTLLSETTPRRLKEYGELIEQLRTHWHISLACPWQGFKGQRYTQQLRDEVQGLIDRTRTRLEKVRAAAQHFASEVGVSADIPQLLKLGDLLENRPGEVFPEWLRTPDLVKLGQDLETCARRFEEFNQSLVPLTARYGKSIWAVPEDTAAKVQEAWLQAAALLAPGDARGGQLFAQQKKLRGWAAETQKRIPAWITEIRTLEKWLGVPLPLGEGAKSSPASGESRIDPSPQVLKMFLRLVHLCQAEHAPERIWIHNPEALDEAQKLIATNKPIFAAFRSNRDKLLAIYTEQFFELDLKRMAAAFAGPYQSWLRIFQGQYRRDRRSLARRSRAYAPPASAAEDVARGSEMLEQKAQIEADNNRRKNLLGRYEKGLETNLEDAEKAVRVAKEAVDLMHRLGCASLPTRFVDVLCAPTPAPEKIRAADKRLQESFSGWLNMTQELQDFLPHNHLPGNGHPLEECALSALVHYARDLQASLNHLANIIDPVLGQTAQPGDLASLLEDLEQAAKFRSLEAEREEEMATWRKRLGSGFQGMGTNWKELRQGLTWTHKVQDWFAGTQKDKTGSLSLPGEAFIALVSRNSVPGSLRELRQAQEHFQQALHGLETRFEPPDPLLAGKPLRENGHEDILKHLDFLHDQMGQLPEWIEWRHISDRFQHLGLDGFWQALRRQSIPADQVVGSFWKSFWTAWIDTIFQQEPILAHFQCEEHEAILQEFRRLDARLRPSKENPSPGLNNQELDQLKKEADKKIRQKSLEQLFETIPQVLGALKPCLLMNPLSVSHVLPATWPLDLVVLDEASQMPLVDALPAIYRGKQVIVAGDPQQLGPLPFSGPETPDIPNILDWPDRSVRPTTLEVFLEANFPRHELYCHYASQHEELVAFANQHFYEGRLTTFPSARFQSPDQGIKIHHLPAGKTKMEEAQLVTEMVLEQLQRQPKKSLGIIVGDYSLLEALQAEMDRVGTAPPKLNLTALSMRHVDWTRGNRHDVVMLCLGPKGDNTENWPWLGQEGRRRLNVASTRAKEKLIVVSSFQATDLNEGTSDPGEKLLAQFLSYAEQPSTLGPTPVPTSPWHQDVQGVLEKLGYQVHLQVGTSAFRVDVGVLHPGRAGEYILGILFDGPAYGAVGFTSERDRLRWEVLQCRGWNLHTLWAPAWIGQRQQEIERLVKVLEKLQGQAVPSSS